MSKESYTVLAAPLKGLTGEVRFKHIRLNVWDLERGDHIHNKGGVTLAYKYLTPTEVAKALGAEVALAEEPAIAVGFAGCSFADNFDRKLGRIISRQRLATSRVIISGVEPIRRLMVAKDPAHVADILFGAMRAQGIRLELCA